MPDPGKILLSSLLSFLVIIKLNIFFFFFFLGFGALGCAAKITWIDSVAKDQKVKNLEFLGRGAALACPGKILLKK